MKVLCAEYNEQRDIAIIPIGDDSFLLENNDFYFPEFTKELSCVPQLVIKTTKLGKFIGEKFANRYYDEIGVGVRFYADTLEQELIAKSLPSSMASAFIGSAARSVMRPIGNNEFNYRMAINDEIVFEGNAETLPNSIPRLVSITSNYHTIKIGDYLFCGNTSRHRNLQVNDHLIVWLNDEKLLDFYIK